MTSATIHTSEGPIQIELFPNEVPKTVENFTKLANDGFYDGLVFHRVIPRSEERRVGKECRL